LPLALETGAWLSIGYIAQAICLQTSSAGAAAFLASLTTVVCPLIESLTGQRLSKQAWIATFLAVCGAACLEFGGGEMPKSGDLIGLLQPLLFGTYLWKTENALEKYPDQGVPITAVQTSVVALSSTIWWGFWYQQGLNPVSIMASDTGQILASAAPAVDVIIQDVIIQSVSDSVEVVGSVIDLSSSASWDDAIRAVSDSIESVADQPQTSDSLSSVTSVTQTMTSSVSSTVTAVSDSILQPAPNPKSIEAGVCMYENAISDVCVKTGKVSESAKIVTSYSLLTYAPKVFALAWLGVLSSAAVLAVESVAVGKLSSSETAVVFSTEPLWAAAIGSLFIGEHIGLNTIIGGAFVLAACVTRVVTPQEIVQRFRDEVQEARDKVHGMVGNESGKASKDGSH
jgi:drug/metabolite transporter (DMT)-like permease